MASASDKNPSPDIMFNWPDRQIRPLLSRFCNRKLAQIGALICKKLHSISALLPLCGRWVLALAVRTLAPLRKIVSRELEVFERCPKYFIYTLRDILECGHESWSPISLIDLLDAYTINPAITARRHRCRPCASLLLTKKPVKSVALGKPAVAA